MERSNRPQRLPRRRPETVDPPLDLREVASEVPTAVVAHPNRRRVQLRAESPSVAPFEPARM